MLSSLMPAADFEPELEPLATGYRSKVAELAEVRNKQIAKATETYMKLLESAEGEATSKGDVAGLGSITKELEAVKTRAVLYSEGQGLTQKLQTGRRLYVKESEKAESDFVIGAKKLGNSYLADLGRIQSKAQGNAELLDQIGREKNLLIAGPPGMVLDARTGMEGTVWRLINKPEDKIVFKDGKMGKFWAYSTPGKSVIVVHWNANSSTTLQLDKNGRILLKDGKPERYLDVSESLLSK